MWLFTSSHLYRYTWQNNEYHKGAGGGEGYLGKPYRINAKALLRQKSKKIHKGVFCSELVAKCYKVRGERGDGEREGEGSE